MRATEAPQIVSQPRPRQPPLRSLDRRETMIWLSRRPLSLLQSTRASADAICDARAEQARSAELQAERVHPPPAGRHHCRHHYRSPSTRTPGRRASLRSRQRRHASSASSATAVGRLSRHRPPPARHRTSQAGAPPGLPVPAPACARAGPRHASGRAEAAPIARACYPQKNRPAARGRRQQQPPLSRTRPRHERNSRQQRRAETPRTAPPRDGRSSSRLPERAGHRAAARRSPSQRPPLGTPRTAGGATGCTGG